MYVIRTSFAFASWGRPAPGYLVQRNFLLLGSTGRNAEDVDRVQPPFRLRGDRRSPGNSPVTSGEMFSNSGRLAVDGSYPP